MFKVISLTATASILVSLFALGGCASAPPASGTSDSKAEAAQAGKGAPEWVANPDSVYPKSIFVAATGYGGSRDLAEKDALAKLISIFGQSIQAELATIHKYSEAVSRSEVQVSQNTSVQNAIKTSSEMDSLVGAEIKEVWFDNKQTYYAVATLEREKAIILYNDLINANQQIIDNLVAMSDAEKNSLDGYARYQFAATIADANYVYANLLTIVDASGPGNQRKKGDDYRLEAVNIAKNIPIGIQITGDRADRIRGAFAGVIAKQGFRSGGTNSRYVLKVAVSFTPVELKDQTNQFTRYVVDANFVDTLENSVLFPFNINAREGHQNLAQAEDRAVASIEKKIADTYPGLLSNYLTNLLPAKK